MQLEHATIPPYLTALYSIHPGTNSDAFHGPRVVAVEEMLHLTLAANLLNAVGGAPDLTRAGLRPALPRVPAGRRDGLPGEPAGLLPDGDRHVPQDRASAPGAGRGGAAASRRDQPGQAGSPPSTPRATRSCTSSASASSTPRSSGAPAPAHEPTLRARSCSPATRRGRSRRTLLLRRRRGDPGQGPRLGARRDPAHREQGEGLDGEHLRRGGRARRTTSASSSSPSGRYYQAGDAVEADRRRRWRSTGTRSTRSRRTPRVADFPAGSEVRAAAVAFNAGYAEFLDLLTRPSPAGRTC